MIAGGLYLVDTSAMARAGVDVVARALSSWGRHGLLASCATVDLEVLFSARSPEEYRQIAALRRRGLEDLPLTAAVGQRALEVQAALAARSHHRSVGVVELLTAATAEHYGAVVVHYDSDFDHVATVTGQPTRWVAPRGSV
jgi:hypothetical protein